MTLINRSPFSVRFAFILCLLLIFSFSETSFGKRRASSSRSKVSRTQKNRKASARTRDRRGNRRNSRVARAGRRGRTRQLSAREVRRQRQRMASEQASALKALQRRLRRPLTKRERAAELRRIEARYRRDREAARRRAEAARRAAIARQLAIEKAMRDEAQAQISRDDATGEDPEVRRVAVNALGNHAGTVVVMDPNTGRIYSAVNQEWAYRRGFKPCSTIKLVTGLAGLNEKVIESSDTATVSDRYRIDLTDALAYSNNTFFQQISSKIGFDKMVSYAKEMGLGQKTGVNVPNEYAGHLPMDSNNISLSRMGSHGDDFEVTPLQLATLVSAMSNGGRLLSPFVPRTQQEESRSKAKVRSQIDIQPEYLRRMVPGMVGAVNYGSGKKAYDPLQTVAGKTGTCISNGAWVGLFTSYAPLANPRLAVVVIARGSDGRKHFPAAVAGQIYRELGSRFGTPINVHLATADEASDSKAAELNEEEKDAADAEAAELEKAEKEAEAAEESNSATAAATPTPAGPMAPPRNSNVKPVLKTIERHNPEPQKATNKSTSGPSAKVTSTATPDSRPRRVMP
jgi:membrane peptidoglycan carboxypeptidase